ncbi:hypothetical protein [Paenisporosarcina sp. TG20]|uniref:hypothetical protein n=1 Tax=Paenisporosarcina sp. TG20 TaxID=1211706 RepID=UPI0002DD2DEC|nr:hypothetical protein [Paenisporosarcina sp. TG20]
MATARESSKVNLDFLVNDLGLIQERNTKVFRKGKLFVISPSVQNKNNLFDIGVNIMDSFNSEEQEGYLLVRYQDQYLMAKLKAFEKKMMLPDTKSVTTKLPPHWKFKVIEATNPYILNMGDSDLSYAIQMPSENQLKSFFNN